MKEIAKRSVVAGLAMSLAAMISGCATVNYSSHGALKNVTVEGSKDAAAGQMVAITTSGYYMFWTIPIASGDLRWDPAAGEIKGGTTFFRDQVGFQELQDALHKIAERRNCDLAEVYFTDSDCSYADVSYAGLIGALFGSSHMSVSAVLVPRTKVAK